MKRENERVRSVEKEDSLAWSNKKLKDHHHSSNGSQSNIPSFPPGTRSYRDSLVGAIPGVFEQAFGLRQRVEREVELDIEEEQLCEGFAAISLSKEIKARIRATWASSLIVKSFSKSLRFMFLSSKIRELWKPVGRIDCINFENDFFLIKFEVQENVDKVLKGGRWFIGQQFLTIRLWELEFKVATASFSSVGVWIRLPDLLIEFYDPEVLRIIGEAVGLVLRVDTHTANGAWGIFARLCVQANLDKPLIKIVMVGKMAQAVLYEGKEKWEKPEGVHKEISNIEEDAYDHWMVVARKKKPSKPKQKKQIGGKTKVGESTLISIGGEMALTRKDGKRKAHMPNDSPSLGAVEKTQIGTVLVKTNQVEMGDFKARCDDLPRGDSNEGGIDGEMEIEGDREPIGI
ncbi:hypothetical protein SO802_012583 [Lithocarpus litseifolius]|uniref:DUF4283 domain-containing protein n=1 Tax=Lithocarpus litseifolius TaxID=425828 RepID=A0AAW2D3S2_9ROSI